MKILRLIPALCIASFACSAAMAQTAPISVPDQAVYQSNAPQGVSPVSTSQPANGHEPAASTPALPVVPPAAVAAPVPVAAGTARDQGYTGDTGVALSSWEMETLRNRESVRNRGEQVGVAARRNGVATDPTNSAWFNAWAQRLTSIGVHPSKIDFEGKRLTKGEFAIWASRQVWAVEAGLIAP